MLIFTNSTRHTQQPARESRARALSTEKTRAPQRERESELFSGKLLHEISTSSYSTEEQHRPHDSRQHVFSMNMNCLTRGHAVSPIRLAVRSHYLALYSLRLSSLLYCLSFTLIFQTLLAMRLMLSTHDGLATSYNKRFSVSLVAALVKSGR